MEYLIGIIIFVFGAALGSFILVVVERYNTGLAFWKGKSMCFSCGAKLSVGDLFPVISFLLLKGRCRYCGAKIPWTAFWAEIAMGALTVLAALKAGILANSQFFPLHQYFAGQAIFQFLILTAIFGVLLAITLYDLKHFIIPDGFLVFLFILALLHHSLFLIPYSTSSLLSSIIHHLLSGLVLALPFLTIFLISKGTWFGFGDVKYIAVLGFLLGLSVGLSAVVLAFWIGAAAAIALLALKKIIPHIRPTLNPVERLPLFKNNLTIKSEVPFGPFLSLGALLGLLLDLDIFQIQALFNAF